MSKFSCIAVQMTTLVIGPEARAKRAEGDVRKGLAIGDDG